MRLIRSLLIQKPLVEWYMGRLVITNRHKNHTCYEEIGQCAQNIDTILGSIVNITIGRA